MFILTIRCSNRVIRYKKRYLFRPNILSNILQNANQVSHSKLFIFFSNKTLKMRVSKLFYVLIIPSDTQPYLTQILFSKLYSIIKLC